LHFHLQLRVHLDASLGDTPAAIVATTIATRAAIPTTVNRPNIPPPLLIGRLTIHYAEASYLIDGSPPCRRSSLNERKRAAGQNPATAKCCVAAPPRWCSTRPATPEVGLGLREIPEHAR
jgi:hypothetical protein